MVSCRGFRLGLIAKNFPLSLTIKGVGYVELPEVALSWGKYMAFNPGEDLSGNVMLILTSQYFANNDLFFIGALVQSPGSVSASRPEAWLLYPQG